MRSILCLFPFVSIGKQILFLWPFALFVTAIVPFKDIQYNCTGESDTRCKTIIRNSIDDFIASRYYRVEQRPLLIENGYLNTTVAMTFTSLNNVDQPNGLINVVASILLTWKDELFTVNENSYKTMSASLQSSLSNPLKNGIAIDPKLIYIPELQLMNGMGAVNNGDFLDTGIIRWTLGITGKSYS